MHITNRSIKQQQLNMFEWAEMVKVKERSGITFWSAVSKDWCQNGKTSSQGREQFLIGGERPVWYNLT